MYELFQTFSCIWVFLLLGTCNGLGTFQIKYSPEYVVFQQEAQPIPSSEVSPIVSQLLGFTVHQEVSWNGLKSVDFFKRPKANVLFTVEGGENIVNLKFEHAYDLTMDTPVIYTQRLVETLESGEFDHKPLIVDYSLADFLPKLKLRYPEIFDSLPSTFKQIQRHRVDRFLKDGGESLNTSKEIDMQFLAELEIASTIINAIQSKRSYIEDNSPDYIHMRFTALSQLRQTYGDESVQVKAAAKALAAFLDDAARLFRKFYNGNVVIEQAVLPSVVDGPHLRVVRSLQEKSSATTKDPNLANVTESYPVVFNIILWLMIILILTTIGISLTMWNMDPGRDSIIYRMTSQRMKKD